MKEYKFLFKRIMLYLMRYCIDGDYDILAQDIHEYFSCDYDLILKVMRLYYGDDIDKMIITGIRLNLVRNINPINDRLDRLGFYQPITGNLRIPDNIQMVNQILC